MLRRSLILLVLAASFVSSTASAFEIEGSVHAGYGIGINQGQAEPYGFAIGGRGGVTLGSNLHFGGLVEYYVGDEFSDSFRASAEVGYDFSIPGVPLMLRPRVGAGWLTQSLDIAGLGDSSDTFVLSPGLTVRYGILPFLFVGLETDLLVPTEDLENNAKSLTIAGAVGVKL